MSAGRSNRDSQPASAVSSAIISRYQTLRRLLIKTSYTSPFPPDLFLSSAPPALTLPVLSHAFLGYSPLLTAWFLGSGFLVSSSTFSLSSLYALLHAVFGYHPQLTQQQFSSERGYVERKLQLLCDVLQMCVAKAEELEKEKGVSSGSAGKGGVPRVAVMVKDKRRSGGEEREERKEQRQRQPNTGSTQRQAKREERKVERYEHEDNEDEDDDDGSTAQRQRQHQHVSFTHDDSSQPLSPSHLSPLSNSMRSPHRLSPPPPSHSFSRSHSTHSHSSNNTAAAVDPLLALHQQLHRISHRTNQLAAHTSSSSSSQQHHPTNSNHQQHHSDDRTRVIERLMERVQALENSVRDELSGVRAEMAEMRQRLAAVEQRESERMQQQQQQQHSEAAQGMKVEEAKESSGAADMERVTSGGSGGGVGGSSESSDGSVHVLPSDMSQFLTHMNDRLSSTAKLLESSRRARGRPSSEGE